MNTMTEAGLGRVRTTGDERPPTRLRFPTLRAFYDKAETVAYAMLRFAFGVILMTHGWPKILGTSHGQMADPAAKAVASIRDVLHLPAPQYFGDFVTGLESFGGAALALGLLTRLVAPMVAVEMAAICFIMGPTWVWLDRGIEYPLLMGFLALYISLRGGRSLSVDRWLGWEL